MISIDQVIKKMFSEWKYFKFNLYNGLKNKKWKLSGEFYLFEILIDIGDGK